LIIEGNVEEGGVWGIWSIHFSLFFGLLDDESSPAINPHKTMNYYFVTMV
jgi:hypothetical protein